MVLKFNNDVVATKAWNHLFAVADWATSRQKQLRPSAQQPTWGEILRKISDNAKAKEALASWSPSSLSADDPALDADEVIDRTRTYLTAWQDKNYGRMARMLSPMAAKVTTNETAGMIRQEIDGNDLSDFTLQAISHMAAAMAEVELQLMVNGAVVEARMRWIRIDAAGGAVAPSQDGSWGLDDVGAPGDDE